MAEDRSKANRGVFNAAVCKHKPVGRQFHRLGLEFSGAGAKVFAKAKAGQFAQLDLSGAAMPRAEAIPENLRDAAGRKILLRRPFSFADVTIRDDKTIAEFLYAAVGPASLRMTTLTVGDSVSVVGPLGNGFSVPNGKKMALLVVGGMGAGPLLYLAKTLTSNYGDMEVIAFVGAKTADELPFKKQLDGISQRLGFSLAQFASYGIESTVATDDGSAGYHGLVTDCVAEWLGGRDLDGKDMIIYSCGPEEMLSKIAQIAAERKVDCQVSMERRMACGIGVCQSCAVQYKVDGSNETIYKMCCKDGPVFDGSEVVWCS